MRIGFEGCRAVVTGAGHGIGRGIAQAFAQLGAETLALDINADGLHETGCFTASGGGSLLTEVLDTTDAGATLAIIRAFGRVDILVYSAGGVRGQVGKAAEAVTPEEWQSILAVNLTGAFLSAQAVIPCMKAAGKGRIVTISSGAGLGISLTGIQSYAAAKAGEIGLTRQLAHELGPFGITVNSVAPGFVRSNPASELQWQSYGPEGQQRLIEAIALRRLGSVEDVVSAVLFLASDYAGWITGQTLSVDGGK
jgi:3-oxoacyl-[acyl-carrier protein] reductase